MILKVWFINKPEGRVLVSTLQLPERNRMEITLSAIRKNEIVEAVQANFRNEQDEIIGELKAEMLVDFFIEKLGPKIYNQAIEDASSFIQGKLIDLEGILYIPE